MDIGVFLLKEKYKYIYYNCHFILDLYQMKEILLLCATMLVILSLSSCSQQITNEEIRAEYQSDIGYVNIGNRTLTRIPDLCVVFTESERERIKSIDLYANEIKKIDYDFSCFPNLEELNISYNKIGVIENLDSLIGLKKLFLHKNQITNLQWLENLVNLEELNLGYNQITKVENLDNLQALKILELQHNHIQQKPNLSWLQQLETVKIEFNDFNIAAK